MSAATAVLSVANIGGIVGINIQQQIHEYIKTSMLIASRTVNNLIYTASRNISEVSSSMGSSIVRGSSIVAGLSGSSVIRVSKSAFELFFKVLKDVAVGAGGVSLAILIYKLVNLNIPCDIQPYEDTLENIARQIESISVERPTVTVPEINIYGWKKSIEQWRENAKKNLSEIRDAITVPPFEEYMEGLTLKCVKPERWIEMKDIVSGEALAILSQWVLYGMCILGETLYRAFGAVTYGFVFVGNTILKGLLAVQEKVVEILSNIAIHGVDLLQTVSNWILNTMKSVWQTTVNIITDISNAMLTVFIKMPAKMFIRYMLKPFISLIVGIYKWFKDNIREALCYFIKISPFTSALSSGLYASRRGLGSAIAASVASFILTSFGTAMLVPECFDIQAPLPPPPQPPQPPQIPRAEVEYSFISTISLSFRDVNIPMPITEREYRALLRVGVSETLTGVMPHEFIATLKLSVSEAMYIYMPSTHEFISVLSVRVTE